MDLWDVLKVALRQWRVLVPMLLLTLVTTVAVGGSIDPEYSATSSFLLIGPNEALPEPTTPSGNTATTVAPTPLNPYLSLSLPVTAEALSLRLGSTQTRRALGEEGLYKDYEVLAANRSPIVSIEVKGDDPTTTVATLDRLLAAAEEQLSGIQSEQQAPEAQLIRIDLLSRSDNALADNGGGTRVRLMILALGTIGSIAVAYGLDGYLAWRRAQRPDDGSGRHTRRHDGEPAGGEDAAPPPPPRAPQRAPRAEDGALVAAAAGERPRGARSWQWPPP